MRERLLSSVQPDGVRSPRSRTWRTLGCLRRYTSVCYGKHIKHCETVFKVLHGFATTSTGAA
jgi:hypothetical protein